MALTLTGSGGVFTRLGKIFGMMSDVRTHMSDIETEIADVQGAYSAADSWMVASLVAAKEARIAQAGGVMNDLRAIAIDTLVEMCWADSQTGLSGILPRKDLESALLYLIRDMDAAVASVNLNTSSVGSPALGAGNTGTGKLVVSVEPTNLPTPNVATMSNVRNEKLEVRCIQDAQGQAILRGAETFEIRGLAAYDNLDRRFPAGSGVRQSISCVSASIDAGGVGQNMLRNTDFENFTTANVADYWTTVTGTAGTHFGQETTTFLRGASAFKMIGDGTVLAEVRQQLGSTAGTPAQIQAGRLYCLAVWIRHSTGSGAGNVRIQLEDATGTAISGTTIDTTSAVGTSFTHKTIVFRAPNVLPSTVYVSIEQSTALAAAGVMYIDELCLVEMVQIAPGGCAITMFAGATDWVIDDRISVKTDNDGLGLFVVYFDIAFNMYEKGLFLPQAASETINDNLIS
jgi:hypothetical protein